MVHSCSLSRGFARAGGVSAVAAQWHVEWLPFAHSTLRSQSTDAACGNSGKIESAETGLLEMVVFQPPASFVTLATCSAWELPPQPAESHDADCLACVALQPAAFVALGAWRESCATLCACEAGGLESMTVASRGSTKGAQSSTKTPKFRSSSVTSSSTSCACSRALAGLIGSVSVSAGRNSCSFPIGASSGASLPCQQGGHSGFVDLVQARDARRQPCSGTLRRAPSAVAKQRVCQHVLASRNQERDKPRVVRELFAVCTPHLSTMARVMWVSPLANLRALLARSVVGSDSSFVVSTEGTPRGISLPSTAQLTSTLSPVSVKCGCSVKAPLSCGRRSSQGGSVRWKTDSGKGEGGVPVCGVRHCG